MVKIRVTIRPIICYWETCENTHRRCPFPWAVDEYAMDGEWIGGQLFKNEKLARKAFGKKIKQLRNRGCKVLTRG